MSGEPKTLTPVELLAIAHEHDWSAHFHDDGYVEIESLGGDALAYEGGLLDALCAATSKVLGVPVVARDEAAELRAAVREYLADLDEFRKQETIAAQLPEGVGPDLEAVASAYSLDDAEAVLRRLAGGESER